VDTFTGKLLDTNDVSTHLKKMRPYREWLREHALRLQADPELEEKLSEQGLAGDELKTAQKMFMVTFEERDQVLRPIAESGQEAVGSMGDDTPM
ncbi:glutamate synthase central domain-containing protein, partial [Acinetobacter gyllenbergii]